ncbi:MAG: two-component system, cell cycle sensor histidine kinase and response regulator CckA [Actinomycetota bacterium]|nr:two-component system, cell cycle sensor histidine kinase and response regulator CckA [Actinomycetota bacterium]
MSSMAHVEQVRAPGVADSDWRLIAESIPHIVWMASPDGTVEYMNQRANDYTGWPPGASYEEIWGTVVHPDDEADAHRAWQHAIRTGGAFSADYRARRADGEYRWFCGRGLPVRDASGQVARWIGTATDIDDQKRLEAALRETGDRLAEAQRLAHLGSWSVDLRTGKRTWSDEMYRLLGYAPQEFEPTTERTLEHLHPDDVGRARVVIAAHPSQGEAWNDEFRFVLRDGSVRWFAARGEPVLDKDGEVVRVHATSQDITERRRTEERLRFQAQLLDAVGEAVIATDTKGTVIYWGPAAEELYGWKADEAQGRLITEMIPAVRDSYDARTVRKDLAGTERWSGLMELGRRDGSSFIAEITRHPVFDETGRVVAVIGTSSDVSRREEAHGELQLAHNTAAEALNLLATLQAEAPVGFAFVDRDLRFVRLNHELAHIIDAPIDEVVGRRVAEVLPPDLWDELEPVYRHVLDTGEAICNRPVVEQPGVNGRPRERLASHYPVRVGDEIIGLGVVVHDITERLRAEEFRSVVMSQVADGVYTQDYSGRLMYMNSAASKMLGWTEFELRGKDMHELVHSHKSDGSGAGVTECALVTEAPHGRLERSEGEAFIRKDGSTFPVAYSAVPLRTGSRVEGVAVVFRDISEPGSSPNMIRVLIVDTDRATTASFQALLDRHEGIEVIGVARTSALAVDCVRRLRPDVALVTADLPDGDGIMTTKTIRAHAPSTKVILMTKGHDDAVAIAGIEAGCAGVLDKSRAWVELASAVRAAYHGETTISQDELQRVLAKVRGEEPAGRATRLTRREEEVLACLREGLPNAKVAERLGVSANTVRNHVQRILSKLNVHSKLEAVVLTSREGL